jgi:SAM-dependent methyltransferase
VSAAAAYAERVDAVLAQRTRLRGPQPPGDLFAGVPPDHPLLVSDPRRPLDANLAVLASHVGPDDVVVDVGGGGGRFSLPLALRCREVVNVDPSAAMLAAFEANARRADIANARTVQAEWPIASPPRGSVALVCHVTYLTREIVPFVEALQVAGPRRVLVMVGDPPPPSATPALFELVYGEPEEVVPGHAELVAVLRELGVEPEVRVLPEVTPGAPPSPTREAAVQAAAARLPSQQWALWPLGPALEARARHVLERHFEELFEEANGAFVPRQPPGRGILITWAPATGRRTA